MVMAPEKKAAVNDYTRNLGLSQPARPMSGGITNPIMLWIREILVPLHEVNATAEAPAFKDVPHPSPSVV
ncbi:hypothetical protein GB937_001712 [Aspergillus fischeri]|nr:hypothetical protein GB937_001712 [Aspergillus fischeri]